MVDVSSPVSGGGSGSSDEEEPDSSSGGGSDSAPPDNSDAGAISPSDPAPSPEPEPDPAPPSDSTGGAVSPSDEVEDAAENADPDPDPAPPSDSTGGTVSPSDETEAAAEEFADENRRPPQDTTGGPAAPSDEVEDAAARVEVEQRRPDGASGGGNADTNRSAPGSPGDIGFRFADQSRAVDSDPEFRTDSGARRFAEGLLSGGRDLGNRLGGGAADAIGADPAQRNVLQNFASAGTTVPGSVAFIGADAADAAGFVTQPARDAVEPGAQLGFDDFEGIGAETATRTGEIGAAAGDAAIEGADTALDIDFERRAEGEGAAISFTDDPQVRQQLAGSLAFGAASLGAAGPASSATRGAVGAASRGARSAADAGSSAASRGADALDASDFVGDTRAARQTGRQRSPGDRETGSPTQIDEDFTGFQSPDPNQGPAAFPDPQGRFEGGAGFSRGSPDRGDVESPADVDPSGSGDGFGYRSPEREAETAQMPPRAGSPTDTDLRETVDVGGFDGGTSRFSSTAAGAGAAGVGDVRQSTDPTGIAPDPVVTGGPSVDPVNDPTSIASTTAVTGTQQLDPASDPTGISPGVEDQLGGGRLGGGMLPGDATDGGTDTGTLDQTNDPTNVAPPGSETDTGGETDTFAPTDTGQPPASDTGQPPVTDTPAPPVVDVPPVTDTPAPPTNQPPGRPPASPPARPPARRRPRRPPEPEGDADRGSRPDTEPDAEFRLFDTADDGGPAVGFGAETFAALATGPFGEREVAEGSTDEFFAGELPAASFLDPADDDEEGVAFVSGLFGLGFGGGGR